MSYNRGDVVLVWFPHSDLETFSKRPAVVVQADNLETGIAQWVIAMVTTNLARRDHPSRVFVPISSPAGVSSGLVSDSVIMTDNVATVLQKAIDRALGKLPDMSEVDAALRCTFGL